MADRATVSKVLRLGDVVEGGTATRTLFIANLGTDLGRLSKGGKGPASDYFNMTGVDGPGPASEG